VCKKLRSFQQIAGYDYVIEWVRSHAGYLATVTLPPGILLRARAEGPFHRTSNEDAMDFVRKLWSDQSGQDIAEYAVMLAVILVIVVGTIRLIGSNAKNVFSSVASAVQ
jgi:Flp pilus assembly pilin Flp